MPNEFDEPFGRDETSFLRLASKLSQAVVNLIQPRSLRILSFPRTLSYKWCLFQIFHFNRDFPVKWQNSQPETNIFPQPQTNEIHLRVQI